MAFRGRYWSCGPFAAWLWKIAGAEAKPNGATSLGWRDWTRDRRENYPITYWVTEEGLGMAQDFFNWPMDQYYNVKTYLRNRFISRIHCAPTYLNKGQWYDTDTRMLHSMFGLLVDYVETEKAYDILAWGDEKITGPLTPWWAKSRFADWPQLRSRALGMARLDWEIDETGDCQASNAAEVKELYIWWKDVYPNRGDPYDIDHEAIAPLDPDDMFGEGDPVERQAARKSFHIQAREAEDRYKNEDTAMMTKLINLRASLWT